MTIYKVYAEHLSWDRGAFDGYQTIGYYTTEAKAEAVREAADYSNMVTGKAFVEAIEVEE